MSRGYSAIGLLSVKNSANVSGAMRAAMCYDASLVVIQGERYKRLGTDTYATTKHVPLLHGPLLERIPYDCVPVGIEFIDGAKELPEYEHPERAFYIFGPEDGSLTKEILSKCRDVIKIPSTLCMNLAATVNVVLYDRVAKRNRNGKDPHHI